MTKQVQKTKLQRLIALMRRRWVTPIDALQHCGLMSLAQRVSLDIQHSHKVERKWIENGASRVRAYRIVAGK